ncbi:MAG: hypothetical protein IKL68_03285 [Clostridia bacterium]|nr:hypothetical protein [Clostridia bacterium]
MGKDYEILEEQYQKLVADKAAAEGRDDLTDEERTNTVAGFDNAIASLEESIIGLANKAKAEIMEAIAGLEDKIRTNEEFKEKAEKRKAELQAEIDTEIEKGEAGDKDKIRIYQAEIEGIDRDLKKIPSEKSIKKKITDQKKKLLPILALFKDKGVFTQEEIDDLSALEKRIERAKKNFGTKDDPVVGGNDTTVPGGDDTAVPGTTPGGSSTTTPGRDDTTTPGGSSTTTPGRDDTTTPGGSSTTTPGGSSTTTPGRNDTTTPGGSSTTTPGRNDTTTPGGSSTTTPGGSRTSSPAAPEAPAELTVEEFNSIYRLAKEKQLKDVHMKKLLPLMSDPAAYTKYGITTGLFRNKAKVLFTAMGHYMVKEYKEPVSQIEKVYGIDSKQDFGEGVVPSIELASWKGIKALASNPKTRIKAEAIYAKVVEEGDTRLAAGRELSGEDERLYALAKKELGRMETFRETLDVHKKVKAKRRLNPIAWLTGGDKIDSLPASTEIDPASQAVRDSVRADIDGVGREAVADQDRTMRDAALAAALASRSEVEHKGKAETEKGADAPDKVDMMDNLSANVYSPEEVKETIVEKKDTEEPTVEFTGHDIDG